MRIPYSALIALLVASATPSAGFAQVLLPFEGKPWPRYNESLDHFVPVATVSRVGDIFTFAHARIVEDGYGDPFVLGGAALDLRDPSHAKIVFTITTVAETPVRFADVMISATTLCAINDRTHPFAFPGVGARPADWIYDPREFQPGEKVTVQIPIPPSCGKGSEPLAILVAVGRPGPGEWSSSPALRDSRTFYPDKALIFRVLERLRVETTHQ